MDLKRIAHRIKKELWAAGCDITQGNVYELIAAYGGFNTYAALRAGVPGQMTVTRRIAELELQEHWELIEQVLWKHMETQDETNDEPSTY